MKHPGPLDNYARLIISQLDAKYIAERLQGDRATMFCSLIDRDHDAGSTACLLFAGLSYINPAEQNHPAEA